MTQLAQAAQTNPTRKRGRLSQIVLCFAGLLSAGCNDAYRGIEARPATTEIPRNETVLQERIDNVRDENRRRFMNTRDHAAWQLVHGILAYQDKLLVDHMKVDLATGRESRERKPALKLLLEQGDQVRGFTLLPQRDARGLVPGGWLATEVEGGSKSGQGHPNQWLGYLLVDYPPPEGREPTVTQDTKVKYRNREEPYTVADMIRAAKMALREGDECGWTLIGLTAFPDLVPPDQSWEVPPPPDAPAGPDGEKPAAEKWSIERILRMEYNGSQYAQPSSPFGIELSQQFHETSCGGTHRLIGMSLAVQRYEKYLEKQGKPVVLSGAWRDARNLINLAIDRMRELQQEDGAFSAQWLQRPALSSDVTVRIRTTGHCLEFLALTLPKEELAKDWVTRAAVHLCELFEQTKELPLDCGATYHALHGLQVYREKRWGVAN
jgi:hypothetical protein